LVIINVQLFRQLSIGILSQPTTSHSALTELSQENNEEKNGSNPDSRGGTTSDLGGGEIDEVVFKIRLFRLDLFCYFLPSREKSKE
jgi:hypothetical protein